MDRKKKVYVPNRSAHDFRAAEEYGSLIFLTDGLIDRFALNTICRRFVEGTKDATADDYILVSSLNILNSLLASVFSYRFGKVNYLLWKNGRYIERCIDLTQVMEREDG